MTAVADLDRETQDRYELVVKATDMAGQLGGLSGSTTVTIVITDVNDNPPRFPQSECPPRIILPETQTEMVRHRRTERKWQKEWSKMSKCERQKWKLREGAGLIVTKVKAETQTG